MAGNVFTSAGEARVVDLYDANAGTEYIGWGTGVDTASKGDTTLSTEASEARVSATRTEAAAEATRAEDLVSRSTASYRFDK